MAQWKWTIEGKVIFNKWANTTPWSAAEKMQTEYEKTQKDLNDLKKVIETNVYTKGTTTKETYRLKPSQVNFLSLSKKVLPTEGREYGNAEFDHMIKTLFLIQYNKDWAGEKYNQITGGNYKEDAIWTIFSNLITFMESKGLKRPIGREWAYTNADFLYLVGLWQALVIKEKWAMRTDKSASQVSQDFGDYILWKKSMEDISHLTIQTQDVIDNTIVNDNVVNNDNAVNDNTVNDNVVNNDNTVNDNAVNDNVVDNQAPIFWPEVDAKVVTQEDGSKEYYIGEWMIPKTKDIYTEGWTEEALFTFQDIKDRWIKNIDYVPIMYESYQVTDNPKDARESQRPKIDDAEKLKELIGLWMKQFDLSISQLKQWIKIYPTKPYIEIEDKENPDSWSLYIAEKIPSEGWLKVRFTDEYIKNNLLEKKEDGIYYNDNPKFEKTVMIEDKPYTLQFVVMTYEMKNIMKNMYNTKNGESYESIIPKWLIYSWIKWIGDKKDKMITIEMPSQE